MTTGDILKKLKELDLPHDVYVALEQQVFQQIQEQQQLETETSGLEVEIEELDGELQQYNNTNTYNVRMIHDMHTSTATMESNIEQMQQQQVSFENSCNNQHQMIQQYKQAYTNLLEDVKVEITWPPEKLDEKAQLETDIAYFVEKIEQYAAATATTAAKIEQCHRLNMEQEEQLTECEKEYININELIHNEMTKQQALRLRIEQQQVQEAQLQREKTQLENSLAQTQRQLQQGEKTSNETNNNIKTLKAEIDQTHLRQQSLHDAINDINKEINKMKASCDKLEADINDKEEYIRNKKTEMSRVMIEIQKYQKLRQLALEQTNEIDEEKKELEQKRDVLQAEIQQIEQVDILSTNKEMDILDSQMLNLKRQLQVVGKKNLHIEHAASKMENILREHQNGKTTLLFEKEKLLTVSHQQQQKIDALQMEINQCMQENEFVLQSYYLRLEQIQLQEVQLKELNRTLLETINKLKSKKNTYDLIRIDKNKITKELATNHLLTQKTKLKYRELNHVVMQYRKEVSNKDHYIVKEHFNHHSLMKEIEKLDSVYKQSQNQLTEQDTQIQQQHHQIVTLRKQTTDISEEVKLKKSEINRIVNERNLLTKNTIDKSERIQEHREIIRLNVNAIQTQQYQLNQVRGQYDHWEQELRKIVTSHATVLETLSNLSSQQQQSVQLENKLFYYQSHVKALDDELHRPLNIHRWRLLECSQPDKYKIIQHIQQLQATLIHKLNALHQLQQEQEEFEIKYQTLQLKNDRFEEAIQLKEQLNSYRQETKDKKQQYQQIEEELQQQRQLVKKKKDEVAYYEREMQRMKKKWLKTKKEENDVVVSTAEYLVY